VTVPGDGHEDVGADEKQDGPHGVVGCSTDGLSCDFILILQGFHI
jgi:hypothetical protein